MRTKDENKNDAIFIATIELLNEIGFSGISMSKIAKRADVSASTIYVYFENKDDMLKKTYLYVKNKMYEDISESMDEKATVKDTIEFLMRKSLDYVLKNKSYFMFIEQFDNSPLLSKLCINDQPDNLLSFSYSIVDKAKEKGELKDMDTGLIIAYCYYPIAGLAKAALAGNRQITEELISQAVSLSWEAIKP